MYSKCSHETVPSADFCTLCVNDYLILSGIRVGPAAPYDSQDGENICKISSVIELLKILCMQKASYYY